MDDSSIKKNLKRLRKSGGYSMEDIADVLEISVNSYQALETGPTSIINRRMQKLADFYGVPLEELILGYVPYGSDDGRLMETDSLKEKISVLTNDYEDRLSELRKKNERLEKEVLELNQRKKSDDTVISFLVGQLQSVSK